MKEGRLFKEGTVRVIAIIVCVALFLGFIAFIFTQLRSQQRKLAELMQEKQRLNDELDALAREQERLQSNLEYVKSLEGLLQYARDNLGYIGPDDIREGSGE
ncbi:MAG: septum formation initiator family protein [Clostridia bacterium]|nr:septum formation initiator family protein [Clostridia bacterium]